MEISNTAFADQLCDTLGWPRPRVCRDSFSPHSGEIVWYESGTRFTDLLLQVNTLPCWSACVYAIRYEICSGWYVLVERDNVTPDIASIAAELKDRLLASHFESAKSAGRFRERYPECANFTEAR